MQDIHRSSTTWLARRTGLSSAARPPNRSHRRRLTLEPLEGRALLSLTTWTVNSLGDSGTGSGTSGDLRYLITQADKTTGDNTINFAVTGTITLYSALPDLSNTTGVTDIEGPGASSLTVARSSAAGTPDFGVFTVDANVQAQLVGLTITGGYGNPGEVGGGINNSGSLTVVNSTVEGNSVTPGFQYSGGDGGGIYNAGTLTVTSSAIDYNSTANGGNGGGLYNAGTMTMTGSVIDNNLADQSHGGNALGGGVNNERVLTVTNSTIDDNSGRSGGIQNAGTMTLTNSTIDNNSGGGIQDFDKLAVTDSTIDNNSGNGISNQGALTVANSTIADNLGSGIGNLGTLTVTNSTIADNSAGDGGGGILNQGSTTVTNSTIADNSAGAAYGGGLWDLGLSASTLLDNTLIALNTNGSGTPDDIAGTVSSTSAYNLIGIGGSGGLVNGTNGNQVGVADPGFGSLADNGGPTQTIALLATSPAIDAGSNGLAVDPQGDPLTTDQRGIGYSRIVSGTVDIGAFEFQTTPTAATHLTVAVQPPGSVVTGSAFGLIVSAEDSSGVVTTSFNGTVTVALLNNPGGATLGGTVSVTAQNGVATFTGLTLDEVGTGYTLQVSSDGLAAATSNAVNVQASGSPTHYTVNLTSDNGAGSGSKGDLRHVINQADANTNPLGSLIQFDPTVFSSPQTITLNFPLPDLSDTSGPTDIEGPGASSLTVARSSAAGTPDFSIFTVDGDAEVMLLGLTITGGSTQQVGGGIYNWGTLTVANSTIDNNYSSDFGGGIGNWGTLTVTNSTIDNNSAGSYGGGIGDFGTLSVTNSTIAYNSGVGGGILDDYDGTADGHQLHHRLQLGRRHRVLWPADGHQLYHRLQLERRRRRRDRRGV